MLERQNYITVNKCIPVLPLCLKASIYTNFIMKIFTYWTQKHCQYKKPKNMCNNTSNISLDIFT